MLSERSKRLLAAYVDGELNANQKMAVERFLRRSNKASALVASLADDSRRLRALPRHAPPPKLAANILQFVSGQVVCRPSPSTRALTSGIPVSWGLTAAAAVLLAVGFGSYYLLSTVKQARDAEQDELAERMIDTRIPTGERTRDRPIVVDPGPGLQTDSANALALRGPPKPEIDSAPPTVAENTGKNARKVDDALAEKHRSIVGLQPGKEEEDFQVPPLELAFATTFKALHETKTQTELRQKLLKSPEQRIDLACTHTREAMDRLKQAFAEQKVAFMYDDDASTCLQLGFIKQTNYAIYVENITSAEILAVMQSLNNENRKLEQSRRKGLFNGLVAHTMSADDHKKLCRFLGLDEVRLPEPRPLQSPPVDVRKSVTASTSDDVVRSLKGQGIPRASGGISKPKERMAIVAASTPKARLKTSDQVQRYLSTRTEWKPATLRVLILVRGRS